MRDLRIHLDLRIQIVTESQSLANVSINRKVISSN